MKKDLELQKGSVCLCADGLVRVDKIVTDFCIYCLFLDGDKAGGYSTLSKDNLQVVSNEPIAISNSLRHVYFGNENQPPHDKI